MAASRSSKFIAPRWMCAGTCIGIDELIPVIYDSRRGARIIRGSHIHITAVEIPPKCDLPASCPSLPLNWMCSCSNPPDASAYLKIPVVPDYGLLTVMFEDEDVITDENTESQNTSPSNSLDCNTNESDFNTSISFPTVGIRPDQVTNNVEQEPNSSVAVHAGTSSLGNFGSEVRTSGQPGTGISALLKEEEETAHSPPEPEQSVSVENSSGGSSGFEQNKNSLLICEEEEETSPSPVSSATVSLSNQKLSFKDQEPSVSSELVDIRKVKAEPLSQLPAVQETGQSVSMESISSGTSCLEMSTTSVEQNENRIVIHKEEEESAASPSADFPTSTRTDVTDVNEAFSFSHVASGSQPQPALHEHTRSTETSKPSKAEQEVDAKKPRKSVSWNNDLTAVHLFSPEQESCEGDGSISDSEPSDDAPFSLIEKTDPLAELRDLFEDLADDDPAVDQGEESQEGTLKEYGLDPTLSNDQEQAVDDAFCKDELVLDSTHGSAEIEDDEDDNLVIDETSDNDLMESSTRNDSGAFESYPDSDSDGGLAIDEQVDVDISTHHDVLKDESPAKVEEPEQASIALLFGELSDDDDEKSSCCEAPGGDVELAPSESDAKEDLDSLVIVDCDVTGTGEMDVSGIDDDSLFDNSRMEDQGADTKTAQELPPKPAVVTRNVDDKESFEDLLNSLETTECKAKTSKKRNNVDGPQRYKDFGLFNDENGMGSRLSSHNTTADRNRSSASPIPSALRLFDCMDPQDSFMERRIDLEIEDDDVIELGSVCGDASGIAKKVTGTASDVNVPGKRRRISRKRSSIHCNQDQDEEGYDNVIEMRSVRKVNVLTTRITDRSIKANVAGRAKALQKMRAASTDMGSGVIWSTDEMQEAQNRYNALEQHKLELLKLKKKLEKDRIGRTTDITNNSVFQSLVMRDHPARVHGMRRGSTVSHPRVLFYLPADECPRPSLYSQIPFAGLVAGSAVDPRPARVADLLDMLSGRPKKQDPEQVAIQLVLSKLGRAPKPVLDMRVAWEKEPSELSTRKIPADRDPLMFPVEPEPVPAVALDVQPAPWTFTGYDNQPVMDEVVQQQPEQDRFELEEPNEIGQAFVFCADNLFEDL